MARPGAGRRGPGHSRQHSFSATLPIACTTADLTEAVLTPAAGPSYFLVVPRNETREGSYGRASDGSERPVPVSTCLLQAFAPCP